MYIFVQGQATTTQSLEKRLIMYLKGKGVDKLENITILPKLGGLVPLGSIITFPVGPNTCEPAPYCWRYPASLEPQELPIHISTPISPTNAV